MHLSEVIKVSVQKGGKGKELHPHKHLLPTPYVLGMHKRKFQKDLVEPDYPSLCSGTGFSNVVDYTQHLEDLSAWPE